MASLAPFVHHNKARINQFLMDLCEVGDFYESLEVFLFRGFYFLFLNFFMFV